jgi:hypothetical protein
VVSVYTTVARASDLGDSRVEMLYMLAYMDLRGNRSRSGSGKATRGAFTGAGRLMVGIKGVFSTRSEVRDIGVPRPGGYNKSITLDERETGGQRG